MDGNESSTKSRRYLLKGHPSHLTKDELAHLLTEKFHQVSRVNRDQLTIDDWETLKDPNTLYLHLLKGFPSQLTEDQLVHLLGGNSKIQQELELYKNKAKQLEIALKDVLRG